MFNQKWKLEVKGQEDRVYYFECNTGSPTGEMYDAVSVMKTFIRKSMNEQAEKELQEDKECKDKKCKVKEKKEVKNAESK